jgi:hypothetical protein
VFTTEDKKVRLNDLLYSAGIITFDAQRKLSVTHPDTIDNIAIVLGDDIIVAFNGIDNCYINYTLARTGLNQIRFYDLSASAIGLATISGTADLAYTFRTYQISASATDLAAISGTADLIKTKDIYVLSASATGLATISGTADLVKTKDIYVLSASASDLSSLSGTALLEYTFKAYVLEAQATGLATLSGTADLQYTYGSYSLSASATGLASISGSADLTYTYQAWSYIGTSAEFTDGTVTIDAQDDVCRTSGEVNSLITTLYEPSDYSTYFVMRVNHSRTIYNPPFAPAEEDCTPYYYESVEVTE